MALQILSNFVESILRAFLGSIKRFQLVPYAILTKTAKSRFYIFRQNSTHENAFSFWLVRFCRIVSNDFYFFFIFPIDFIIKVCYVRVRVCVLSLFKQIRL